MLLRIVSVFSMDHLCRKDALPPDVQAMERNSHTRLEPYFEPTGVCLAVCWLFEVVCSKYMKEQISVSPRRPSQPAGTPPDLPPERAYSVLKGQLEKIEAFKGQRYDQANAAEDEFYAFTSKLVMRSFGSDSPNYRTFCNGSSAGQYVVQPFGGGVDHGRNQRNFLARLQAYESALRSCISELELDLPDTGIKGVYEPGQEYEFYSDVTACLKLAQKEIFVVDPYLSTEIFDVYAKAIPRTVKFRLLSANVPADVQTLAQKYATGGNFAFRTTNAIHDRVLFADNRVWVIGQSIKDAAKKKPTYIIEHDEPMMRNGYEDIWNKATVLI
jgi:hypothetical protein